ncbi:PAS domain S-box protein [Halorussus limi]|uniref:histidine kinase n=1 Tax=Halorussus limi TaxID=2938695 RepID=A0A8U0HYD0_9EURY|nr:PAS domain S-box protein [Halorussus limi]UPV75636.1 PAS domain S-box protein [Halorussus limi]
MGYLARGIEQVGGRRVVLALGGLYVAIAVAFPVTPAVGDRRVNDVLMISLLVGASGLALSYGGYRLSQSDVRPDLYHVVAGWCVRAIEVMVGILLFISVITELNDPLANFLILPALASVAGLGMGYHDGQAQTRAVDAEEYSQELERYETIVQTVNDGIFVTNEDNRFILVNDAYTELVGYDREEIIGSPASFVMAEKENAAALREEVERDLERETFGSKMYETRLQTASGEIIEVEWTVAPLPEPEDTTPDTVGVVRDVTERNERERRLERQNEQLDNFASLLAHELRNPVNIGQIYSQQLSPEEHPQAVEYVTEAFDRIEDMIEVLLLVARGREAVSECSPVRLADAARQAWDESDTSEATLDVTTDLTIDVDETYIRHLFRNLFENAVEHGGASVTVTVGDLPTGFYVADDGRGIEPDEQKTVFETGYTSSENEGGMGLGLTFVQEMADVYGWECSVAESAAGGARFEFENVTKTRRVTE